MSIMTRGFCNQNPFNIKFTNQNWKGKVPRSQNTDGVFEQFRGIMFGLRAGLMILRTYNKKYHCKTLYDYINRFAPDSDGNDTKSYISYVYKWINCFDEHFDIFDEIEFKSEVFYLMAQAMCMFESKYCPSIDILKSIKL